MGLTERQWEKRIIFTLTDHKFTLPAKCIECYRMKKNLIISGEWDSFPPKLKDNLSVYALIHEKNNPGVKEHERHEITLAVEALKESRSEIDKQIENMERYAGLGG